MLLWKKVNNSDLFYKTIVSSSERREKLASKNIRTFPFRKNRFLFKIFVKCYQFTVKSPLKVFDVNISYSQSNIFWHQLLFDPRAFPAFFHLWYAVCSFSRPFRFIRRSLFIFAPNMCIFASPSTCIKADDKKTLLWFTSSFRYLDLLSVGRP